jgi:hypothetical protein
MSRRPALLLPTLALTTLLGVTGSATASVAQADPSPSRSAAGSTGRPAPYTFAVIGDVPYGDPALAAFPAFIQGINDDPDVRQVVHLGDVKSGSTTCDDQRLGAVSRDFDLFQDPLYYTPGDNEWTDCHRANNGAYQPLERLAKVRSLFFSPAGRTQGERVRVTSQADVGVPENLRWSKAGLSFATLHVVGSNNDLAPWDGIGRTRPTREQVIEERRRMRATIAHVRAAFADARSHHRRAVVLLQQADMFDPTVTDPAYADYSAFKPLVQAVVDESRHFDGQVYLFNGDSHRFNTDRPLAQGSPWLDFYGVSGSADGLQRVTVDGSDLGEADWLKVTTHRTGEALTFEQVPGS